MRSLHDILSSLPVFSIPFEGGCKIVGFGVDGTFFLAEEAVTTVAVSARLLSCSLSTDKMLTIMIHRLPSWRKHGLPSVRAQTKQ